MEVSDQLHAPGTHWVGGWDDAMEKRKISFPSRESNRSRAVPCFLVVMKTV
jgi:hypothetical protein